MSGGHAHGLYVHEDTRVHALPAQCKVVAWIVFVVAVVATPREEMWAFALHALLVSSVVVAARIGFGFVSRRLLFETPFLLFALALPLVAGGDRIDAGPVALSAEGLWAAWNVVAKATLGTAAAVVLAATTPIADLLRGLEALRVPRAFTSIAGFMSRYADVIAGEMRMMAIARRSRAHDPRYVWQARGTAAVAGTLFVRSFERGERIYAAMLSRGFTGALPRYATEDTSGRDWAWAAVAPGAAAAIAAAACLAR